MSHRSSECSHSPPGVNPRSLGMQTQAKLRLAGVMGEQGDLDAVVEPELLEHARDVRIDGGDAHLELAADLGVGLAEPDPDGDLALAVSETVELLPGMAPALSVLTVGQVADQPAGDRR
jgi:hypothetical protein